MTSLSHQSNMFEKLSFQQTSETENYKRKANKKLREIAELKKKPLKSQQEWDKINQEEDWLAIVKPISLSREPTPKEEKERKEKQREKTKLKKLEKQIFEEKQKHKKELKLLKQQLNQQFNSQINDLTEQNKLLFQENKQLKNAILLLKKEMLRSNSNSNSNSNSKDTSQYYTGDQVSIEEKIEDEFLDLYREEGSYKKAYYKMMKIYHPDKCNKEISGPASRVLSMLKSKYIKS